MTLTTAVALVVLTFFVALVYIGLGLLNMSLATGGM